MFGQPDDFKKLGTALGALVAEKNAAYGNSAEKIGVIMGILYPGGIPKEKISDALLLVRMLDKMNRIADGDPTYRGEDPWQDIGGYALIGQRMQRHRSGMIPGATAREIVDQVANNKPYTGMHLTTTVTPEWVRWNGGKPEDPADGK